MALIQPMIVWDPHEAAIRLTFLASRDEKTRP
jgi:hypothetical protein